MDNRAAILFIAMAMALTAGASAVSVYKADQHATTLAAIARDVADMRTTYADEIQRARIAAEGMRRDLKAQSDAGKE